MADTWESLIAGVQVRCSRILEKDVAPIVRKILLSHIQKSVYGSYSPVMYPRRGALSSEGNLMTEVDGNELFVTSVAPPAPSIFKNTHGGPLNPADSKLLQWIEFGCVPNHFNNKTYAWMEARPVIAPAQAEVAGSSAISGAITKGIMREF